MSARYTRVAREWASIAAAPGEAEFLDLSDCTFDGPALPAPFVRSELGRLLVKHRLLPLPGTQRHWLSLQQHLKTLGSVAGPLRVHNHLFEPLANCLGYAAPVCAEAVRTREGAEDGGWLMQAPDGTRLRSWSYGNDRDLDSPSRNGRAYRFSPMRCAQRVLSVTAERIGLLGNGHALRLLFCDPARPNSHFEIRLPTWRNAPKPPDAFRLLLALATPQGIAVLPEILEAARLSQARVTKDLRIHARAAIEGFLQNLLDLPANASRLAALDQESLPQMLWQESLVLVYRLLFLLKMESTADPARAFSFAASRLWRRALSPNQALGALVRRAIDQAQDTGRMLEDGLRALFRAFCDGLCCTELRIAALGGALFGSSAMPTLDALTWGERGVALLLDRLLWTTPPGRARERVHYGALDVEELGRVYEGLLDLEPGIAVTEMLRLRRSRLDVVLPSTALRDSEAAERIAKGCFYLRAGFGRKATGSYYTPHAFVRFLVRETLLPQVRQRSPDDDPRPAAILALKVVDPAMGSGHFLVEVCRFLGDALYGACRTCDELAAAAERAAERALGERRAGLLQRGDDFRSRLFALPDAGGTLLAYLPSRASEGGDAGFSERRAIAYCRRLVAVHCLYGVDRNALAIELAKLSLWLESYAEGLPLTFLDHRLLPGDSIAGPFFNDLAALPVSGTPLAGVVTFGITERLQAAASKAREQVRTLEASIGRDAADMVLKQAAKQRLDVVLRPLDQLARAWSGAAALGLPAGDLAWLELARHVARDGEWPPRLTPMQATIMQAGAAALPWDLTFPEIFASKAGNGFDAVLGNPPWDVVQYNTREFIAAFDPRVLDAPTRQEAARIERRVLADPAIAKQFAEYQAGFDGRKRLSARLFHHQQVALGRELTAGNLDTFRLFAERKQQLLGCNGAIGMLVPSAFHANEGTTALRQLYLQHTSLETCFCFENRCKLFDIDSRYKFSLVVARAPGPTRKLRCAFYLDSLDQIDDPSRILTYDPGFLRVAGGEHLTLPELRSDDDLAIARQVILQHGTLGTWCGKHGIAFGRDLHMTDDAAHFIPAGKLHSTRDPGNNLLLHEGKTFHQFTDQWDTKPRYAVPAAALRGKPATQAACRYFRLAFRDIARASDERTLIAMVAPPGVVFGHTANTERMPQRRPAGLALVLCALLNSFVVDWAVRQKAATHLSLFIVHALPLPEMPEPVLRLLAHGTLRLSCNHAAYAPLWRQQLGATWREAGIAHQSWPALCGVDARWRVRAAMDAVVAQCFGLDRQAYQRLLASFSHKSFPAAPGWCLDAFDALTRVGTAEFVCRSDPYSGTPLPE